MHTPFSDSHDPHGLVPVSQWLTQTQPYGPPRCSQRRLCSAAVAGRLRALSTGSAGSFFSRLSWKDALAKFRPSLPKIPIMTAPPSPFLRFRFPPYHLHQIKLFSFRMSVTYHKVISEWQEVLRSVPGPRVEKKPFHLLKN